MRLNAKSVPALFPVDPEERTFVRYLFDRLVAEGYLQIEGLARDLDSRPQGPGA